VQRLLAGDTLEWDFEGKRRKIRFLSPEIGVVNTKDPVPLHISALGPRGRKAAKREGPEAERAGEGRCLPTTV